MTHTYGVPQASKMGVCDGQANCDIRRRVGSKAGLTIAALPWLGPRFHHQLARVNQYMAFAHNALLYFPGPRRLWDCESGECLQVLEGHTDEIFSCAFNYEGDFIITGG